MRNGCTKCENKIAHCAINTRAATFVVLNGCATFPIVIPFASVEAGHRQTFESNFFRYRMLDETHRPVFPLLDQQPAIISTSERWRDTPWLLVISAIIECSTGTFFCRRPHCLEKKRTH